LLTDDNVSLTEAVETLTAEKADLVGKVNELTALLDMEKRRSAELEVLLGAER
jgi:hypothetical protein